MLYQRLRLRNFVHVSGPRPIFPGNFSVLYEFSPPWPFGTKNGDGLTRTAVMVPKDGRMSGGPLHVNKHRGFAWSESKTPLTPLQCRIEIRGISSALDGTTLKMDLYVDSLIELEAEISSVYFWLPVFLNVEFGDPPTITEVTIKSNNSIGIWVPQLNSGAIFPTTQERQQAHFIDAMTRTQNGAFINERRFLASLEYFYAATRLATLGETAGEFLAESILNYAKILEVLFPSNEESKSADAARNGLKNMGYNSEEIEWRFIPAVHLRNKLGVGHARLSSLAAEELEVVHDYADQAEGCFRELIQRILKLPEDRRAFLVEAVQQAPSADLTDLINKMRQHRGNAKLETRVTTITNPPTPVPIKSKY